MALSPRPAIPCARRDRAARCAHQHTDTSNDSQSYGPLSDEEEASRSYLVAVLVVEIGIPSSESSIIVQYYILSIYCASGHEEFDRRFQTVLVESLKTKWW